MIDFLYILNTLPKVASALPMTLVIMVLSLLFGMMFALLLAYLTLKNGPVSGKIAKAWISFMRGVPELVLLFLLYFGLPQVLLEIGVNVGNWNKMIFIVAAFSFNISSFLAEVLRSSYLAVDRGQQEAAYSVGMNGLQAFTRIILPQAFAIALPNLGNTVIILFKDTSLAFTIGVVDMIGKAKMVGATNFGTKQLELYICVAILYWVVCFVLQKLTGLFEKMNKKGYKNFA